MIKYNYEENKNMLCLWIIVTTCSTIKLHTIKNMKKFNNTKFLSMTLINEHFQSYRHR